MERLTALLTEVLEETGYTKRHPANCDEGQIRRLVLRMGLTASDVPVWMGILRQILWKIRGVGRVRLRVLCGFVTISTIAKGAANCRLGVIPTLLNRV